MNVTTVRPKYELLAESIAEDIRAGKHCPGDALPSVRSLMESSSCGMSTVVRCLKVLESDGLVRCHPRRGYFVEGGHDRMPGVRQVSFLTPILRETTTVYAAGVKEGLADDEGNELVVALYCSQGDADEYRRLIHHLLETRPTGVILVPAPCGTCGKEIRELGESGIPLVIIGLGHDDAELSCDRVLKGVRVGAGKLAAHLLENGCQEYQLLASLPHGDPSREVFSKTLREQMGAVMTAEYVFDVSAIPHPSGQSTLELIETYEQFVGSLLDKGKRLTTLVCNDDYGAFGAIAALKKRGLNIPDDVRVASGVRGATLPPGTTRLTTVDYHRQLTGRLAGEMLARRLEGYDGPTQVHHISGDLIIGDST